MKRTAGPSPRTSTARFTPLMGIRMAGKCADRRYDGRAVCYLSSMKPSTDYIRHAARLARKLQMDAAMGGTPQPDTEFYKALAKALDEIAAGLELVAKAD